MSFELISDWQLLHEQSPSTLFFNKNKFLSASSYAEEIEGDIVNIFGTSVLLRADLETEGNRTFALHSFRDLNINNKGKRKYSVCIDGISQQKMFVKWSSPIEHVDLTTLPRESTTEENLKAVTSYTPEVQKDLVEVSTLFNDYRNNVRNGVRTTYFVEKEEGAMRFAVATPFHDITLIKYVNDRIQRIFKIMTFLLKKHQIKVSAVVQNDENALSPILSNPYIKSFFKEQIMIAKKVLETTFNLFEEFSFFDLKIENVMINKNWKFEIIDLEVMWKHGEIGVEHVVDNLDESLGYTYRNANNMGSLVNVLLQIKEKIKKGDKIDEKLLAELKKHRQAQDKYCLGALLVQLFYTINPLCLSHGEYDKNLEIQKRQNPAVAFLVNQMVSKVPKFNDLIRSLVDDVTDSCGNHRKLVQAILQEQKSAVLEFKHE